MSNNIFSGKRFSLLCKQHIIHNTQLLFLSTVAYIGVIFIVLSFVQVTNSLQPLNREEFQVFLIGFVAIFGALYVGHSFPAFRSKESTMNYLMLPASAFEKFLFEFISRIGIMLLLLPLIYWSIFHIQGYFFTMFTDQVFYPVGLKYVFLLEVPDPEFKVLIYMVGSAAAIFGFVLAFTGAAMFTKQPLVKTLFSVAVLGIFYIGYSYVVIEHLGIEMYHPPSSMWLLPIKDEIKVITSITVFLVISTLIMLYVAYRKLKEREV